MNSIGENIAKTLSNIETAAVRSGRTPDDITLICVSKTRTPDEIAAAVSCGQYVFGENKVQEITDKVGEVQHIAEADKNNHNIKWHMIGHLQRNKVKYIIDKVDLIHSVDSIKLAEEIDSRARQSGRKMEVLLQINAADEEQKFGVSIGAAEGLLNSIEDGTQNIVVKGLMSVVPASDDPEDVRRYFREVKHLFDDIKRRYSKEKGKIDFEHLSMGMTHDYEIAIEEGATMVRVGTGIFGPRK